MAVKHVDETIYPKNKNITDYPVTYIVHGGPLDEKYC